MAAKDSNGKSKTSKTAHVMSLLSKKQDPAVPEEESAAPVPPILSSLGSDAAVSVQIKNALEEALEEELNPAPAAPPSPAAAAPAQPEKAPAPQPAPQEEVPPQPPVVQQEQQPAPAAAAPVQDAPPAEAPAPRQPPVQQEWPAPSQPPAPAAVQPPVVPERPGYINVMQVLVEEKAAKYVQLFGLCQCPRCMEDVKALTLNHLPPKYVVMGQGEMIPKLTFYEGKYSSDITAQLLHACETVRKAPHHDR